MTINRGHNCQHFVMNRQYDSIFSAYKRMFIIWNIFCNVLFEFHNKNGGCMNGHCHSFDINPNLAYSGWLVSIGNGEETHWHYTVHEPLLFIEELLLVVVNIMSLFFSETNADLISFPSFDLIGIFCKLGSADANLPVLVAANKKEV